MQSNKFEDSAQHIANTSETPGDGKGYASGDTGDKNPRNQENRKRRVLGAGTLTGDRVRNTAGDDLGKIEEIMIDLESGRVAYAVLSFGGFLGIGDKLFMVPWSAMTVDQSAHEFVLDVSRSQLEKAPGFDKNDWPDMTDADYGRDIHKYWQVTVVDFGDDTANMA
jgi:sporulation protein YlmC with PRC-barrel domain